MNLFPKYKIMPYKDGFSVEIRTFLWFYWPTRHFSTFEEAKRCVGRWVANEKNKTVYM